MEKSAFFINMSVFKGTVSILESRDIRCLYPLPVTHNLIIVLSLTIKGERL